MVARNAQGRSDRINKASDGCVRNLKSASDHLKAQGANYKVAYAQFQTVLGRADVKYEMNKAIEDSIQGLLVAAAVAALGPEVAVVKGAQWAAEAMAASSYAAVRRVGAAAQAAAGKAGERVVEAAKAPIGESVEQATGKGIELGKDAAQLGGPGAKPSETAGSVSSDQFSAAFAKLDEMVAALPQLGEAARSQVAVAMAAQELGKEALRLAGAGDAQSTLDDIIEKAVDCSRRSSARPR